MCTGRKYSVGVRCGVSPPIVHGVEREGYLHSKRCRRNQDAGVSITFYLRRHTLRIPYQSTKAEIDHIQSSGTEKNRGNTEALVRH